MCVLTQMDDRYDQPSSSQQQRAYDDGGGGRDDDESAAAAHAHAGRLTTLQKLEAIDAHTMTPARRNWHVAYNAIRTKLDHQRVSESSSRTRMRTRAPPQ